MLEKTLRKVAERSLQAAMDVLARPIDLVGEGSTVVVFAPHPDDETLGCGGLIVQLVENGAQVHIVFMTDGERSHAQHLPMEQLAKIRETEAAKAAEELGVNESNLHFLRFPDSELGARSDDAQTAVRALLAELGPSVVVIPTHLEPPDDHWVTGKVVKLALGEMSIRPGIVEYGVWIWNRWPWVAFDGSSRMGSIRHAARGLAASVSFVFRFRGVLDIERSLETKRRALSHHRSQMEPLHEASDWATLGDVANGELLRLLLGTREYFAVSKPQRGANAAARVET